VKCVSYKTDVSEWLTQCHTQLRDEAPIIAGIEQYQGLLAELTNMETVLDVKLQHLILEDPEHVRAAFAIGDALVGVKAQIQLSFWLELSAKLKAQDLEVSLIKPEDTSHGLERMLASYYSSEKNRDKLFGLSIKSTKVDGLCLNLVVDHNLYYTWTRDGERFLACVDGASGTDNEGVVTWTLPREPLNFMRFDEDCQAVTGPEYLGQTVANYAAEMTSLLGCLENGEG
jgi:hypothetical protein